MGLEASLKELGYKLSRPLKRDCYDFAYRLEQLPKGALEIGRQILNASGDCFEEPTNGYINVALDLWQLHKIEGWPSLGIKTILYSGDSEAVLRRAYYLSQLLKPQSHSEVGQLDPQLRLLLQSIHFPELYLAKEKNLGHLFWTFTLERNLRQLPDFTQGQIYSICKELCECSKMGTCAH